jgi:hypothetical protein
MDTPASSLQPRFANPIYDSAFKHLMEDAEIARGIIERLLGCKVLKIELRPHEITDTSVKGAEGVRTLNSDEIIRLLRVLRLDFHAEIAQPGPNEAKPSQSKTVLIELQKGRPIDVRRFRTYLGHRYSAKDGDRNLPIVPIYLLGYNTDSRLPKVTRVVRQLINGLTGQPVNLGKESADVDFIEQLTHNSVVVQLAKTESREDIVDHQLDALLTLFDQKRKLQDNHLLMTVDPNLVEIANKDTLVHSVLRTLQFAASDETTMRNMEAEDQVTDAFAELTQERDEAKAAEARERAAKEQERAAKEAALAAEEKERAAKEAALVAKEAIEAEVIALRALLKARDEASPR